MIDPPRTARDFVWGVSTSSYQIEGGAHVDGRGDSIWDTFCREPHRIANGDSGEHACDHYSRFAEDVVMMREHRIENYRFSISWPRILPAGTGAANEAGLAFYDRLIDALLAAGITPWLCLYHWDLPQALQARGGWAVSDCVRWFSDYAALIARRYGDRVKHFATFNEPAVFTLFGYGYGAHAPGIADRAACLRAIHHVNLAHGGAVDVLRALVPAASIGNIHNVQPTIAASDAAEDLAAAQLFDALWNCAFPDAQLLGHYPPAIAAEFAELVHDGDLARICRPLDWFGLNHYAPNYIKADRTKPLGCTFAAPPDGLPQTSIGWTIAPEAFRDTLVTVSERYRLPIYVMENGMAVDDRIGERGEVDDAARIDYLRRYTAAMGEAFAAGADVRGYFVWSLMDNFEWTWGYAQRFGLVYVDFATGRRTPKASARWYADLIRGGRPPRVGGAMVAGERYGADPHIPFMLTSNTAPCTNFVGSTSGSAVARASGDHHRSP
jgi:beta-glucosidase